MDTTTLLQHRQAKDEYFATDHGSPLDHARRPTFDGLRYYDPNPDLVFTVPVEPGDGAEVRVATSDGAEKVYRRLGRIAFDVAGQSAELTLYSTGHPGLFIPVRDSTSGKATYGAGRYLDVEPNGDGTVTIDFNYAYNPYCTYSEGYSCPLPPGENWLNVPIEAGELDFPTN